MLHAVEKAGIIYAHVYLFVQNTRYQEVCRKSCQRVGKNIQKLNLMSEVTTKSSEQAPQQGGQTVIVNQVKQESNGLGTGGFVLALLALFLCWVPVLGWILWALGLILSFVGVFKQPKGLAIAGLVLSLLGLILLIAVVGAITALVGL
jgi:hypothetical protein